MPPSPSRPPLHGKIALVTGASGGIGRAICRRLAAQGCSIGIHFYKDGREAHALCDELTNEYGKKFMFIQADMGDYAVVQNLYDMVSKSLGPITILINNAGTTSGIMTPSSIADVPITVFEENWRTNCGSAYLLTQLCIPDMEAAEWGRVIFVSSVAGITGGIIGPHYASSTSALHGLIHWLANTYAKKGITVNGVAPALIADTKMLPGRPEELAKKIPIGRLGVPDEVAGTVAWMVETGYVTNKVIAVDGGMVPQH